VEKDRRCPRKIPILLKNGPGVGDAEAANPTEGGYIGGVTKVSDGRNLK
jgi:hypothetical protein